MAEQIECKSCGAPIEVNYKNCKCRYCGATYIINSITIHPPQVTEEHATIIAREIGRHVKQRGAIAGF